VTTNTDPVADPLIDMAQSAAASLARSEVQDLDGMSTALTAAMEAARHFRVQLDLGGRADVSRMIAFESLFRSTVELQPRLGTLEIDATVDALLAAEPRTAVVERLGEVRANAFVVARAILDTLRAGYRVGFMGTETKR
jgi:hypothetical protein